MVATREQLRQDGFTEVQIQYLQDAEELVRYGWATSVDDLEYILGYGVVDAAVLRDTFFND